MLAVALPKCDSDAAGDGDSAAEGAPDDDASPPLEEAAGEAVTGAVAVPPGTLGVEVTQLLSDAPLELSALGVVLLLPEADGTPEGVETADGAPESDAALLSVVADVADAAAVCVKPALGVADALPLADTLLVGESVAAPVDGALGVALSLLVLVSAPEGDTETDGAPEDDA